MGEAGLSMGLLRAIERLIVIGERVEAKVDRLLRLTLTGMEGITMTLESLVADLDAETNAVAAKLDKLSADLAAAVAAGQAPKPETLAALQAVSDRLKVLGSDPSAPIPPVAVAEPTP